MSSSAQQKRPIILDLMGGDFGPSVAIKAASCALNKGLGPLTLVGTEEVLAQLPVARLAPRPFLYVTAHIVQLNKGLRRVAAGLVQDRFSERSGSQGAARQPKRSVCRRALSVRRSG